MIALRVGKRIEAMAQQQRHRQPRIVFPADRHEAVVRRHEHYAGHGPLRGEMRGDGGAEAPSEHDDAARIDAVARGHRVVDRQRISG